MKRTYRIHPADYAIGDSERNAALADLAAAAGLRQADGELDQEAIREKTLPARLGGPCQQTRPDRLGRADPQGGLSPLCPFDLITSGHPKW